MGLCYSALYSAVYIYIILYICIYYGASHHYYIPWYVLLDIARCVMVLYMFISPVD